MRCANAKASTLRVDLDQRRAFVADLVERIAKAADEGRAAWNVGSRSGSVSSELELQADETAVAQEIVRMAARSDISEEIARFRGHVAHWEALADGPEPCGRKLDFLLQEMNREVNTMGSKADGLSVSELIIAAQGRAREDARADPECRIDGAACCSSCRLRSGAGKTTLVERLVEQVPNLRMSRSYTSSAGTDRRDRRRGL